MQLTQPFALRWRQLGIAALLVVLALAAVYGPGLGNGLVFDDSALTDGTIFGKYGSLLPLQPRLLSYGSFVWLQSMVGESWALQRALNVVLHGITCVALFLFIRELLALPARSGDDAASDNTSAQHAAAIVATAFFALHPIAVYGVAYLVQRSIVMATLFGLLACWTFLRGLHSGKLVWLAVALLCYLIAILCKETAVMIGALSVPFYVYVRRPGWKHLLALALAALAVLAAIAYVLSLRYGAMIGAHAFDDTSREFIQQLETLQPGIASHAYWLSVLNQTWLFFGYAALWALPNVQWMAIDLRPAFPLSYGAFPQLFGAIGFVALMLTCAWLLIRRRDAWGLAGLLVLSAGLLFGTEFATSWVQDPFVLYRSYLWAPMLCALLALILTSLQPRTIYSVGLVLAVLLSALSWERVQSLHDTNSAWSDAVDKVNLRAPASAVGRWRPYINRGAYYLEREAAQDALRDFDMAIQLGEPMGSAQMNRAVALQLMNRHAETLKALTAAESMGFKKRALYYHRAVSQAALRQYKAAFDNYTKALAGPQPDDVRRLTQLERAQVALPAKQYKAAIADLKTLLAHQPDNDKLKLGLGMAYLGNNQLAEALSTFDDILARQPLAAAHFGRAQVLMRQGDKPAALQAAQQAAMLEPRHPGYRALARQLGATPVPPTEAPASTR